MSNFWELFSNYFYKHVITYVFHRSQHSDLGEIPSTVRGQILEPIPSLLDGFHLEGLTLSKLAIIHLVLASMNIKLVKYCEKCIPVDNNNAQSVDKVYFRRKYKPSPRVFLVILRSCSCSCQAIYCLLEGY